MIVESVTDGKEQLYAMELHHFFGCGDFASF